jgi:hypothetical protein
MHGRRAPVGQIAAAVVGALLAATMLAWAVFAVRKPHSQTAKLTFGTNDEVYYFHPVTVSQAASLGQALQNAGYFHSQGANVQILKWKGATTVSFVLNDGAWDKPLTMMAFEEIGRRVAPVIGGYPIQVNLSDNRWTVHRSLTVGKVMMGQNDAIYYYGTATDGDAKALGEALQEAGYLKDLGASETVAKDAGTSIGFVVNSAAWERLDLSAQFERLARRVAPAVGGMPVELRLLNDNMDVMKSVAIR